MRIRWATTARQDLRELNRYIARDSKFYARRFVAGMLDAVSHLADHPQLGRRVPEADRDDVREIIYRGYRVIYLLCESEVFVLTVMHGARDLAGTQLKPWEVV